MADEVRKRESLIRPVIHEKDMPIVPVEDFLAQSETDYSKATILIADGSPYGADLMHDGKYSYWLKKPEGRTSGIYRAIFMGRALQLASVIEQGHVFQGKLSRELGQYGITRIYTASTMAEVKEHMEQKPDIVYLGCFLFPDGLEPHEQEVATLIANSLQDSERTKQFSEYWLQNNNAQEYSNNVIRAGENSALHTVIDLVEQGTITALMTPGIEHKDIVDKLIVSQDFYPLYKDGTEALWSRTVRDMLTRYAHRQQK